MINNPDPRRADARCGSSVRRARTSSARVTTRRHPYGAYSVEVTSTAKRQWRITFTGGAEAFWLPDYSLIESARVAGAKVTGACWDESWLVEASIGESAIHIRLFGEPISVEELAV